MKYINLFETQAAYDAADKYYPNVSYIEGTDEIVYAESYDYSKDYLTFEALESGTFTLNIGKFVNTGLLTSVSYSIDNGITWIDTANSSSVVTITTPTIAQGGKVLWKGIGVQMGNNTSNTSTFSSTGNFKVSGNIMSLLYGDNFENQTSFANNSTNNFLMLFYGATKLVSAENLVLPATTMTGYCCYFMFSGCTSLTTAPALPATTLADSCYKEMFYGCTALTTATVLPATTLVESCYYQMFMGCTSLTTAPVLPATTLANHCYQEMFRNCTNLNSITMLATDITASECLSYWMFNAGQGTGTFTKAASMTTLSTGYNGIPAGWTVVDAQ